MHIPEKQLGDEAESTMKLSPGVLCAHGKVDDTYQLTNPVAMYTKPSGN